LTFFYNFSQTDTFDPNCFVLYGIYIYLQTILCLFPDATAVISLLQSQVASLEASMKSIHIFTFFFMMTDLLEHPPSLWKVAVSMSDWVFSKVEYNCLPDYLS